MKTNLLFELELPYLQTEYDLLKSIALNVENIGHSKFKWIFKIEDIEKVVRTLGKTFEFDDEDIKKMIPYSPLMEEKVGIEAGTKGKGYFKIIHRAPKLFICETIINEKPVRQKVPTENVSAMWKVMNAYSIGRYIKSSTVAENVITELEITRFNRGESGNFDFAKFFGERADYYRYFYGPLKILQSEGVIEHTKSGTVARLADGWDLQTQIRLGG